MFVYPRADLTPIGYWDSDFQLDLDFKKSMSGLVFTLGGCAIIQSSVKRSCIANSTMEAEYAATCVTTCKVAKEAIQLQKFLIYLQVVPTVSYSMTLYYDNSGATGYSKERRSHKRAKHNERKYHIIWEIVGHGDVTVCKIAQEENLVDPFTKILLKKSFKGCLVGLGTRKI